jgi:hypothetical protein
MTLTQNQRKYRKYRDEGKRDFHRTETGVRVGRKALCVRVSEEANRLLNQWCDYWGWTRWEMITHLINHGLPRYSSEGAGGTRRYVWRDELLNPTRSRPVRSKGETGDVQLNERITSTAWKTLECHRTVIGQSKARIVQRLILEYQPVPEHQREKNRQYREQMRQYSQEWKQGLHRPELKPLTPEQQQELEQRRAELMRADEERWQMLMREAVERYQHGE